MGSLLRILRPEVQAAFIYLTKRWEVSKKKRKRKRRKIGSSVEY
jgi:hypothetical protein